MTQRKLKIEKTREYVWRVFHFGSGAHHNWITCWHVVDADTGERLTGGYSQGNNTRSGYAEIERKKDAKAFIDGYEAATRGEVNYTSGHIGPYVRLTKEQRRGLDSEQQEQFKHGARVALGGI